MKLSTTLTTLLASSLLLGSVATAMRTISSPNPLHADNAREGNTTSRVISNHGQQHLLGSYDFGMTDPVGHKVAAMHEVRSVYHEQCKPSAGMIDTHKLQCLLNLPTHLALILDHTEGVELSEEGQAFVMWLDMTLRKTAPVQHEKLLTHISTIISGLWDTSTESGETIRYGLDLQELRLVTQLALADDVQDIIPLIMPELPTDDQDEIVSTVSDSTDDRDYVEDSPHSPGTSDITTTYGSERDSPLSYYDITVPSSVRAGEIFGIEVKAMDSDHAIITDYSDSIFFTINSPQSNYTVPLNGIVPFAPEHQGVRTLDHSMMIRTPGRYTLTIENLLATVSKKVTIIVTAHE